LEKLTAYVSSGLSQKLPDGNWSIIKQSCAFAEMLAGEKNTL
jgi:hypothetical protein